MSNIYYHSLALTIQYKRFCVLNCLHCCINGSWQSYVQMHKHTFKMLKLNNFIILKTLLFIILLILTLWRAHDCVQKYLKAGLGTKVSMVQSHDTITPALTLCPEYYTAYDLREVLNDYCFLLIVKIFVAVLSTV